MKLRAMEELAVGVYALTQQREREGAGLITGASRDDGDASRFASLPASAGRTLPNRQQAFRWLGATSRKRERRSLKHTRPTGRATDRWGGKCVEQKQSGPQSTLANRAVLIDGGGKCVEGSPRKFTTDARLRLC